MTHVTVHDRGREHSMDERLAYYVVLSGMTLQHNYYNCCVWVYMCMDVYEITFRNVFPVWEKTVQCLLLVVNGDDNDSDRGLTTLTI